MSRTRLRDAGFTMLEIIAAVMVLGIALAALTPQVVSSLRATGKAKMVSQAKGVLQGQLDAMRALPFRIAPSAGDHLDLLDTYFRNLTAPTTAPACGSTGSPAGPLASWTGYVAPASTARCGYEPAQGGAFYRYVIPSGVGSVPADFAITLDTQFVSASTPATVLTPATGFNTQATGFDRAPVQQVGVIATVFYRTLGRWYPDTAYTQIAAQTPASPRIRLAANATAVELGSNAPGGGEALSLTGGQLALSGTLFNASEAKVGLTSIAAASSVSGRQAGASLDVSAPYSNLVTLNAPIGTLTGGCSGPCWGATAIPPFVVAADNGLPRAGVQGLPSVLGPVQTLLPDNLTRDGFQFATGYTTLPGLSPTLVSMDAVPPVGDVLTNLTSGLYNCAFSLFGPVSHLTASGYLNSTDELAATNPLSVEACGGGHTDVIRVLPTDVAPDGLVRITARSSAKCTVTGAAHTPSADKSYRAEVEYWSWTRTIPAIPAVLVDLLHGILGHPLIPAIPGHGTYVSAGIITPSTVSDPLAAVSLAAPVSDTATLGDYLDSWAGLTAGGVQQSVAGHIASLTVPALVTLQTTPVRGAGDPASAVSVAVGASSCYAEDNR